MSSLASHVGSLNINYEHKRACIYSSLERGIIQHIRNCTADSNKNIGLENYFHTSYNILNNFSNCCRIY